jgi:hypothetical protein
MVVAGILTNGTISSIEPTNARRDHQKNRRGSDPCKKGEIGQVKAPGNLIPHGGRNEAAFSLLQIGGEAQNDQDAQKADTGAKSHPADENSPEGI